MSKSVRLVEEKKDGAAIGKNQAVQTQEMHCVGCGRFLGFQAIIWGVVKIKCPNCKEWNTIDIAGGMAYDLLGRKGCGGRQRP